MKKGVKDKVKVLATWLLMKISRVHIGEKTASLTNGAGETGNQHVEKQD